MSKAVKNQVRHIGDFTERWNRWRSYLQELVQANNGVLICPEGRELIKEIQDKMGDIEGSIKIKLPYPICLYNIPKKQRGKGRETLSVFIDGSYELEEDPRDYIRRIKSQVAFYETIPREKPKFKLLDAYHFDFFDNDIVADHDPHPTFHVQREISISTDEPRFDLSLNRILGHQGYSYENHTTSNISTSFRHGAFRIPTPQLDILNLGAVVAADQLVGKDSEICWNNFQALLDSIHGRNGEQHHVKAPKRHKAKIYDMPRKQVADWYCSRY